MIPLLVQTLPGPPHVRAVLVCTTEGLPDLEVVCHTSRSSGFRSGHIDFGDGSDPTEIETNIPPPEALIFIEQLQKDIKDKIDKCWNHFKGYLRQFWKDSDTSKSEGDDSLKESFLQVKYHHKYERAGEYTLKLFLEGDESTDTMDKVVTLQESRPLENGLIIKNLNLIFTDNKPTRSFEFRVMQILRNKRILRRTSESRQVYSKTEETGDKERNWVLEATKGWVLTGCTFDLDPDLQHDKDSERIKFEEPDIIAGNKGVNFCYTLSTRGWILGRPYVRFDGVVNCKGELEEGLMKSRKKEVFLKTPKIKQYGIIGIEDDKKGDKKVCGDDADCRLVYDGNDSIKEWSFEHNGTLYSSAGDEPIEIPCHDVELSLVDPPTGLQPEDRYSKAWLEVDPLN